MTDKFMLYLMIMTIIRFASAPVFLFRGDALAVVTSRPFLNHDHGWLFFINKQMSWITKVVL